MADLPQRAVPVVPTTAWMRLLPPAARFVLCGDAAVQAALAPVWQAPFSDEACRAGVHGSRASLWLGPDEYLLLDLAPAMDSQELAAFIDGQMAALPHALVDISQRQCAIEISGPNAAAIINSACPLDLDPAEFPVNMCTRTVLAKAEIVLWRTAPDVFHLEVWRSFVDYVGQLLCESARP
jgi:sarcosine oxidase subunit gamma